MILYLFSNAEAPDANTGEATIEEGSARKT